MANETRPTTTQFDELFRELTQNGSKPKPWVEADGYPWQDEQFSNRYARRVDGHAKGTGEAADEIVSLLDLKPKARVLDLCAGNGRHAIALALRGFKLTALDVGPGAVAVARETARNLGLSVDFRQLDVRHISFEDAYDAAYLVGTGISAFSPADAQEILQRARAALVPGGGFLGEFYDAGALPPADQSGWRFVGEDDAVFHSGPYLQLEQRLVDADLVAEVVRSYVVGADGSVRDYSRCRQYYSAEAIKALLDAAKLTMRSIAPGASEAQRKVIAVKA